MSCWGLLVGGDGRVIRGGGRGVGGRLVVGCVAVAGPLGGMVCAVWRDRWAFAKMDGEGRKAPAKVQAVAVVHVRNMKGSARPCDGRS